MEEVYFGGTFNVEIEKWSIINNMKVHENETIQVTIPPGIKDSDVIELKNKGNKISNNQIGDVKICVSTKSHHTFIRLGMDLIYKKTISLKEALCGFAFDIEHLNKRVISFNNSKANTIIHPGFKKIINEFGFRCENHLGNLIIEFDVKFPETLSQESKKKLENIL